MSKTAETEAQTDEALRPKRRRSIRGERTRGKILEAARDVFAASGFDKASTQEIAKLAGCAEGTVFLHFNSKQGLLMAVLRDFFDEFHATYPRLIENSQGPEERLWCLLEVYANKLQKEWQLVRVLLQHGRYGSDALQNEYRDNMRKLTALLNQQIDDLKATGVYRPELKTSLLRNMISGTIEHYALSRFERQDLAGIDIREEILAQLRSVITLGASVPKGSDVSRLEAKLDQLIAMHRGQE